MGKMVTDATAHKACCGDGIGALNSISVTVVSRLTGHPQAKFRFWPHFWKSLIAIIMGNAAYFLLLSPNLPPAAHHAPGRLDIGLVVDFWTCLVCFGVLELLVRAFRVSVRKA